MSFMENFSRHLDYMDFSWLHVYDWLPNHCPETYKKDVQQSEDDHSETEIQNNDESDFYLFRNNLSFANGKSSYSEFLESLPEWIKTFDWDANGMILAGGYLLAQLLNIRFRSSDIDVWFKKGRSRKEKLRSVLNLTAHVAKYSFSQQLRLVSDLYGNFIWILSDFLPIQLILQLDQHENSMDLISNFDLACCRLAFDSSGLLVHPTFIDFLALDSPYRCFQVTIPDRISHFNAERAVKYFSRGISLKIRKPEAKIDQLQRKLCGGIIRWRDNQFLKTQPFHSHEEIYILSDFQSWDALEVWPQGNEDETPLYPLKDEAPLYPLNALDHIHSSIHYFNIMNAFRGVPKSILGWIDVPKSSTEHLFLSDLHFKTQDPECFQLFETRGDSTWKKHVRDNLGNAEYCKELFSCFSEDFNCDFAALENRLAPVSLPHPSVCTLIHLCKNNLWLHF